MKGKGRSVEEESAFLAQFITEHKLDLIEEVLEERTRHLTVVLENIYRSQNASAVIRTSECFGIQDIHAIENSNEYSVNPDVTRGSQKWIHLHRYREEEHNTRYCLNKLKGKGYKVVVTTLEEPDVELDDLSVEEPLALVFGNEMGGISREAFELADHRMRIPMYGFTQSFNLSVSAALSLRALRQKLSASDVDWKLGKEEKERLRLEWYQKVRPRLK